MRNGWTVVHFEDAMVDVSGGNATPPQSEFLPVGRFAVVDQGKELVAGYVDDESRVCRAPSPVIVFGDHTRCFKYVDFPFCMGADGVKVLRPKVDANPKYLFHYLRQLSLTDGGYDRHFKYLKRSEVIVSPIAEQQRIADILERAEALRAKRREALAKVDALVGAVFEEIFGNPGSAKNRWPLRSLREIGKVTTGQTPPGSRDGMYGGQIPFVTPGDLESAEPVKRTLTADGADAARTVRAGAALVCCIGATIGKMGAALAESGFNQQLNAVEWNESVDDVYGLNALRLPRQTIISRGASTTLPILKKSLFEKLEIPVPPLPLQREFAARVAAIERLKASHLASLAHLDALFASLQHRTFRGEL